ncbi:unnamed protein product [Cylindrotheca closterium]|uniref:Lon N-terminal domain-containing protein n=1 Tax=Cylindrotheca closterium TaxID=2856 RepID=A0AAD2CPC4_9STRA|nr:unnamed protein product [Cylindrotheca closterium]
MKMKGLLCIWSVWLAAPESIAFVANQQQHRGTIRINDFSLFGISEWRDSIFNLPGADRQPLGTEVGPPAKEICILPFPYDEVLLQGQEKQLRLYEDRFIKLFDYAMEQHSGVVAMGLIAESGIIQTVPICEIEAYNRMEGFGIFVTLRVCSRGQLLEITQQDPWLKATCTEISDKVPPNLELPNLVASNIENFMLLLSSMEHRLAKVSDKDGDGDDKDVAEMRRKLQAAKLDDRFYDDLGDDEDDEVSELDRKGRFTQAYNVALSTDTQGYCVPTGTKLDRTPQELTAISWAAFCTNVLPDEDASFRIQALDADDLFDRLKLASHMLREKKSFTRQMMEKAGLKLKGDEDFDEDF